MCLLAHSRSDFTTRAKDSDIALSRSGVLADRRANGADACDAGARASRQRLNSWFVEAFVV